jgi:RNA polymerase-binding transcription factor DksA
MRDMEVQDALRRIDDVTFGKCLVDDGPIEVKRLGAVSALKFRNVALRRRLL